MEKEQNQQHFFNYESTNGMFILAPILKTESAVHKMSGGKLTH